MQFIQPSEETPVIGVAPINTVIRSSATPTPALQYGDNADHFRLSTINELMAVAQNTDPLFTKYSIAILPMAVNSQPQCWGYAVNRTDNITGIPDFTGAIGIDGSGTLENIIGTANDPDNVLLELNCQFFWPNGSAGTGEINGTNLKIMNFAQFQTALKTADANATTEVFLSNNFS